MNKRLRTFTLGAALLVAGIPTTSDAATQTASGTSKVTVVVPDVIILDYFTRINLGLSGQSEQLDHGTYEQTGISGGDQEITGTGALTTSALADASSAALRGASITINLRNVWAIRGFSPTGKATVSVTGPTTLTKALTSSTIGVTKLQVMVDGALASTASNSISANLNGVQKVDSTTGDVLMGLNFTNTYVSGDYTGTITISAVTL